MRSQDFISNKNIQMLQKHYIFGTFFQFVEQSKPKKMIQIQKCKKVNIVKIERLTLIHKQ